MQQKQSQLYLKKIKMPSNIIANLKIFQLLDELNACCTTISNSQIASENSILKEQVQSAGPIFKKTGSFLQGQDIKIEELSSFAIWLSSLQKDSSKLTGNFIGLMNKFSIIIIPNLIKHLPTSNQLIKNLICGVSNQQQLLKGQITYKLFIALFQYQSLYILKQSLPQITQYFGKFIPYFFLIQKQIKGDKQQLFHVLRVLIKYYSIVLVLLEQRRVPNNFYSYLKGSEVQFVENYCNYVIDQFHEEMFFITLEKYVLVDPQYRATLLNTIHKIYQFNFKSCRIMKFYKIAINLMNKQIFSDHNYDQDIFCLLFEIKVILQRQNIQNFNQMVIMLISQKSVQFFINYKNQFIKIASISQQIKKKLFPFYYQITFTKKEIVDLQILNAIVQWNLNLQIIPTQKFIQELIVLGINKLAVQTQAMIFTKQSANWSGLKSKIIQKKCQQYLECQQTKTAEALKNDSYFKEKPQIYQIYFKMFLQLIINSQCQKFNKNLQSCFSLQVNVVYNQQNIDRIKKINKLFLNILQKAVIYQIKDFYLLKDISLIHSLLQIIQPINLDNKKLVKFYIQNIQNLTTKQINQLIQFLLRIFAVFKNYFTLYLIISCGLHIYSRQQNQFNLQQPFIKVIQYIVNIQNQSSYAKITSYHSQNLIAITLLINITKSQQLIQKCQQLITNWSSLFNSYDLDLILYQFDKKNYIQYLKIFQIKYQPVSDIQKSIFLTLTQISQLLRQSNIKSCNYLSRAHNSINFIPIIYQNHKNNIQLSFKALLNSKMCCYSYVQIHGSSRENPSNSQKHRIVFKNKQIIFYNRSTKQVICSLQLQQQHYSRPFAVTINIANSKIKIQINKTQLISKQYNLLVQNIKFQQQGDLMLKQLKWKRFGEQEKDLSFKQYLQIYPNEFQIKISKTHQHQINNVNQKFNILYIATYLQQIIQINGQKINLQRFYSLCCDIIIKKQGDSKQQFTPTQFACLRKLFNTIFRANQTKKIKIQIPQNLIKDLNQNSSKFYQFLTSFVLNGKFLMQASNQSLLKLYVYLYDILFFKKIEFRIGVQNKKLRIFSNIIKSIDWMQEQVRQKYCNLVTKLLLTHQTNAILLKKIQFLFYISHTTRSQYLQQLFENILFKMFTIYKGNQDTQLQHNKIIGRYFLTTYKNIQLIFVTGTPTIKMKILDNMIADQQLNIICHKMFNELPNNQLLQLNSWLIMNGKRNMFEFFDQQSQESLINLIFFLTQLSKLFLIQTDITHRQEIIAILHNFIKKSGKLLIDNDYQQIIQKLQNFYSLQSFVQIISEKISQYTCQQIKNKFTENFINDYFNVLFQIMPKVVTIKALQQFRKCSQYSFVTCIYLLRLEDTHMLPQRNLSAFLQYILQILFIMKHQQQSSSHLKQIAQQVKQYVQIITQNYAKQNKVCKVNQTFLYSWPKMFKRINFNDQNNVKKLVHTVKKTAVYEVHGGICFKLMCIAFHILQILPTQDHSNLLTFVFDKLSERYKLKYDPSYKMADSKAKSHIQIIFKEHEKYYQKFDQQIFVINAPIQRRLLNVMAQKQKQLTSYFLDFFFMKMFLYLQYSCWGDADPQQIQLNKNYSKNILKLFRQYTQIYQQMNQKNLQSIIEFVCVDDLLKLIQDQGDLTVSDQMNSPNYSGRMIGTEAFQTSKTQFNPQFFNLNLQPIKSPRPMASPRSPRTPRSPRLILKKSAFETKNKRKLQILSKLQSNIFQWSQQGRQKQIHRYFRQQTKQIFFNQLLHQLYIITSSIKTQKAVNISKGKRLIGFIQDIGNQFTLQDRNNDEDWKNIIQQIKKVQKFTCLSKPQIQLNPKCLPNITHPFIRYTEPHNITTLEKSIIIKPRQQLISQITSPAFNLNFTLTLQEQQKKQSLDNLCQLSTIEGVYFGLWEMQNQSIKFTSKAKKQSSKPSQRFLKYGSPACNIIPRQNYQVVVQVQDILQIFYRKYNQIKNNSLQFFLKNGQSIYLIMFTQYKAKMFIQRFKRKYQHSKSIKMVENFVKQFENQGYTQKWRIGQMSNFDYLMMVNKYSGRSKCDLNQYYIFPWILQDYNSEHLDISNSNIYRDLKKPIGALRKQKFQKYLQKFLNLSTYQEEKYFYGSHYSTSLFIFYYLVRLQPFTTQHKDMQGGIFDSPDRLFSSIQQMWECLISQSSTSDIKESIPQFYYFPTFLKNINNLDLGMKQSGKSIGDVQLPNWAQNPADFIIKMRNCLESDYVSANLNYWIDLIFGKDQKSQEKYNIFHPLSYVENMNAQKIAFSNLDATISQITFFGQNPYQLFSKQHPKKKIRMQQKNLTHHLEIPKKQGSQKQLLNNNFNLTYQQQNLHIIYYISSMQFQNKKSVKITISSLEKQSKTRSINLEMQNSLPSLIRSLQNIDNSSLKRMFSQKNLDLPEQRHYKACSKINQNQFQINIETKNKSQIIKKIKLPNKISGLCYNQIIFVTYSHDGLKAYDWNQDIIWQFSNQYGQITDCYLDINVIIFVTSQGKLYVYDFLGGYNQLLFQYTKQTYQVKMLVYAEPKQITKKNQNSYKILLVGDKRKIIVMHYTHQIGNKYSNN